MTKQLTSQEKKRVAAAEGMTALTEQEQIDIWTEQREGWPYSSAQEAVLIDGIIDAAQTLGETVDEYTPEEAHSDAGWHPAALALVLDGMESADRWLALEGFAAMQAWRPLFDSIVHGIKKIDNEIEIEEYGRSLKGLNGPEAQREAQEAVPPLPPPPPPPPRRRIRATR
jgi:hypothetical protein